MGWCYDHIGPKIKGLLLGSEGVRQGDLMAIQARRLSGQSLYRRSLLSVL